MNLAYPYLSGGSILWKFNDRFKVISRFIVINHLNLNYQRFIPIACTNMEQLKIWVCGKDSIPLFDDFKLYCLHKFYEFQSLFMIEIIFFNRRLVFILEKKRRSLRRSQKQILTLKRFFSDKKCNFFISDCSEGLEEHCIHSVYTNSI